VAANSDCGVAWHTESNEEDDEQNRSGADCRANQKLDYNVIEIHGGEYGTDQGRARGYLSARDFAI